jgi:signal transduction histidine kinase/DNA-binding response OmpR family regulator
VAGYSVTAETASLKNYIGSISPKSTLLFETFPARQFEYLWRWGLTIGAILLLLAVWYYQKMHLRRAYLKELESQNQLIRQQKQENERVNEQLQKEISIRMETNDTINYFATSLFGKNTVHEILWDVAKNCISRLGLVDCVIYLVDEERGVLVQKAAYGKKNPEEFKIYVPIEIPLGMGIVGSVYRTGVPEIVEDASLDSRYIVDDQARLSELAVPLIVKNRVIGVIDSEHPEKNFFTRYHLDALNTIASICASKISQSQADERATKAREAQLEAEQIKALDQMKSQFFANISHEFRTPLHLILAPLQKKHGVINEDEKGLMTRNAKRLLRLVNQLLDLTKMEVGLVRPEPRNLDVFRFVNDISYSFSPLVEPKDLTFRILIPEREVILSMDPDKLEKIIYNLLSNAFKFTPKGGAVSIQMGVDADSVLSLVVSDNGIGIPAKVQSRIFKRFYQVDSSQTRAYEGSGLGLALTKELVDLLGGSISVESKEGEGSVFNVQLPAALASKESYVVHEAVPRDLIGFESYLAEYSDESKAITAKEEDNFPVVLLVEDNYDLRQYMRRELSGFFAILEAVNGEEGLSLAQNRIPDLIVTDIMMPVMDGVMLIENIKNDERTSHIPVILLTARDDGDTKITGFETGAEQYLVKPFEINELIARIKSLLAQSERLRKKFSQQLTLQPSEIPLSNKDVEFLDKVVQVIEMNIDNEAFTVEHLQSQIGMSRMQLHRKLKALTNQSASDFIRSLRLKRAAQILRQPGMQVAEAAYLSGFNHMSYFAKCFKEQFGVLPSEFSGRSN